MQHNFSRASFALIISSSLLLACQKDMKENNLSRQLQQNAKINLPGEPVQLTHGLGVSLGSTTGPGGDLFVADGLTGTITRINPKTGQHSIFASGLPQLLAGVGIGGVT